MDYIGSLLHRTPAHKVAAKAIVAQSVIPWTEDDFLPTIREAQVIHQRLQRWIAKFPTVLTRAKLESREIPDEWVWQDRLQIYWEGYERHRLKLEQLDEILDGISLTVPHLEQAATLAREATFDPPREARLVHAFEVVEFFTHRRTGEEHIAYNIERLKEWAEMFGSWVTRSVRTLEQQSHTPIHLSEPEP